MIEAVNFSGPTFVIFNHFQHGLDAVPLKRSRRVITGFICYWIGASVTKMFQGPAYTFVLVIT